MILASKGSSSGMLQIPAVWERDAGLYTCRAVNELGDASADIRLEVGRECTPWPHLRPPPPALPLSREERTRPGSPPVGNLHHAHPEHMGWGFWKEKVCALLPAVSQIAPTRCGLKQ